jgi:hypothetical protein
MGIEPQKKLFFEMGIEPMNLSKSVKWNLCKCLEMGVEPMNILKVCIYRFFFYTLVMVFVHYGAVIIALYEAVHCLYGHHKFG